jgi:hypothetical protein
VECSDETPQAEYVQRLEAVDGLSAIASRFLAAERGGPGERGGPAERDNRAAVMELVLEGLHQHSMVSKLEQGSRTAYRDMLKAMFERMPAGDAE